MPRWSPFSLPSRIRVALLLATLGGVLIGCGPLDDGENPTPTVLPAPTRTDLPAPASPVASPRSRPAATPLTVAGSPAATASRAASPTAARPPTGGAAEPTRTPARPTRTPRPEAPATEETAAPGAVTVAECEIPDPLPNPEGATARATNDGDVNFRDGPGTSCGVVLVFGVGTPVEVLSGPVQVGNLRWVLVEFEGRQGWVAEQFLDEA